MGVAIYAKTDLDLKEVKIMQPVMEKDFEFACCEFNLNTEKCILLSIYRSPSGNINIFLQLLESVLDFLFSKGKYIIICGDFNIDFAIQNNVCLNLLGLFSTYGLIPHVNDYTRVNNISKSRIDNIFSNISIDQLNCIVINYHLSDHDPQLLSIRNVLQKNFQEYVYKRSYNEQNINRFANLINLEKWDSAYSASNPNDKVNIFLNIFHYHFDICFPKRKRLIRKSRKWVSPEIREWSTYIRDLWSLYKNTKCRNILDLYNKQIKEYKYFISQYKKQLNDNYITNSQNKSKATWNVLNTNLTKKDKHCNSLHIKNDDNVIVSDPNEIINLFSKYFSQSIALAVNVVSQPVRNIPENIFLEPTNPEEIANIILSMPNKNSSGLDEVPISIIKKCQYSLCKPLSDIANACLSDGIFPEQFKVSKTIPIHKKGDRQILNNYRGVTVPVSFSKILEKIIYIRFIKYLNKFQVIRPCQYGFLPSSSTEKAIYNSITDILSALDSNKKVSCLYFDLTRAFDTVDYRLLLDKLNSYGIRGIANKLIESYLSNRTQVVTINTSCNGLQTQYFSNKIPVKQGVPQGSVLGPLLFVIYSNDLQDTLNIPTLYQFADDTSVIVRENSISICADKLRSLSQDMVNWCNVNHFTLNEGKTELMTFSLNKCLDQSPYVPINGRSIQQVDQVKFLGIIIDSKLNWEPYTDSILNKLISACFLIRSIRAQVYIETLRTFYFSYVQSILEYGIIFWGSSHYCHKLFITQKRIIRCMLHIHSRETCRPHFKYLNILTVPSLYIYRLLLFVKKNPNIFARNNQIYNIMTTRNGLNLSIPTHNHSFYENGPYYNSIRAYNALPNNIKSVEPIHLFKIKLKTFLIDNAFYSLEEFLTF